MIVLFWVDILMRSLKLVNVVLMRMDRRLIVNVCEGDGLLMENDLRGRVLMWFMMIGEVVSEVNVFSVVVVVLSVSIVSMMVRGLLIMMLWSLICGYWNVIDFEWVLCVFMNSLSVKLMIGKKMSVLRLRVEVVVFVLVICVRF